MRRVVKEHFNQSKGCLQEVEKCVCHITKHKESKILNDLRS